MFFLDAHTHFYPCYSIGNFFNSLFNNIENISNSSSTEIKSAGIILTERNDCNFYHQLLNDPHLKTSLSDLDIILNGDTVHRTGNINFPVKFYPGRQVSSIERVEVLALFHKAPLPENLPLPKLIKYINEKGALPVINWAPGKWSGKRGELVSSLLENSNEYQNRLLLGFTSLLPKNFSEPFLIKKGRKNNIPIIAGSDPLPFKGQESLVGSCGLSFQNIYLPPIESNLKDLLLNRSFKLCGNRSSSLGVFIRLLRNEIVRRTKQSPQHT